MSARVDETAIRWALRIDARNMDREEERALDSWLGQDDRHRGALFRARAGLALVESMGTEQLPMPAAPRLTQRRWFKVSGAIAAGIATLLVLSWGLWPGEQYRTAVGEVRRVALADGSIALVNTSSDLEVSYGKDVRQLRLDEGEAWFKVAKNKLRPFVVVAGDVHVQATGTAFAVRQHAHAVEVVVTEGTVRVWRGDQSAKAIAVSAGETARVDTRPTTSSASVAPIGDRDPLAWRQGGLALNETTVFEAVAEFNRYNVAQIDVQNSQIGNERMTGYFQIDQPEEFSQAVADVTHATLSKKDNKFFIK